MNARAIAMSDARRSRWIPWAFVAFFGVVLAANAAMVVIAITSWPGLETRQAYQRGLAHDEALEAAAAQAALGWEVEFAFEQTGPGAGALRLDLADRFGNVLQDAEVRAALVRPTHGGHDLVVAVPHHYGGRYLQDVALPLAGQWEARVQIVAQGREYRLRERIWLEP
jgi:nitrogen fixation protein FixH